MADKRRKVKKQTNKQKSGTESKTVGPNRSIHFWLSQRLRHM